MKSGLVKVIVISIVVGIYLAGCGSEQKQVRLAYKFAPDKIYHFIYTSNISSVAYEDGNPVYSNDKTHQIAYTQEVVEVIDSATGRLSFTYTLDDKVEAPKTWNTQFVMASDGRVLDFFPNEGTSDESLEYYRHLFEQAAPMYPDEPVYAGYTWRHTVKTILKEGSTDASTTYKIRSFVRESGFDCAVIEYKGNMIIPLSGSFSSDSTVITSGFDRIQIEGVAYFAYTEGIIIREDENSHLVREGTVKSDGETVEFRMEEKKSYSSHLKRVEQK